MNYKTFEDYLMYIVMELHPEYSDDDYPDLYEDWLAEQEVEDIIKWANLYGEQKSIEGGKEIVERVSF